jgi:hypothetical protein
MNFDPNPDAGFFDQKFLKITFISKDIQPSSRRSLQPSRERAKLLKTLTSFCYLFPGPLESGSGPTDPGTLSFL